MRYQRIVLTTIALIALATGSVVAAEPSEADLVTSCTGTASNVTVPGDLFVPAGRSCELTSVVVNGNTTVRAGANLLLTGSTLNGSLTVQADGFASASGATVTGATRLNTAFGAFSENSSFGGNVVAADSGFFYSLGSSLQAVTSSNGETYLESVRMSRNLTTAGDLLTDVYNSVVQGTVSVTGASMGSVLCVSEIDGNASFSGSGAGAGGILQIGASAPLTGCGFNVFAASVALTDNLAPSFVSDNVIRGALVCTGNNPAPVGSSTRIRGQATGQCAAPAPAAAARFGPAAASGTRKADIQAKVESRRGAGEQAATMAGPARIGS